MTDLLFKLKILAVYLSDAFGSWRSEYWKKDLDSLYCCNGRECGCQGSTVREMWKVICGK